MFALNPAPMPHPKHKPTLLIIEDNQALLRLLLGVARLCDVSVVTSDNGRSGLTLARERKPDTILCNVIMPGMSGFDLIREINKLPARYRSTVILMSGDTRDRAKAIDGGATAFLVKPFKVSDFSAAMGRCLPAAR